MGLFFWFFVKYHAGDARFEPFLRLWWLTSPNGGSSHYTVPRSRVWVRWAQTHFRYDKHSISRFICNAAARFWQPTVWWKPRGLCSTSFDLRVSVGWGLSPSYKLDLIYKNPRGRNYQSIDFFAAISEISSWFLLSQFCDEYSNTVNVGSPKLSQNNYSLHV